MPAIDISLPLELNRTGYPQTDAQVATTLASLTDTEITWWYGTYDDTVVFNLATGLQRGQEENDNALRIRNKSAEVAIKQFKIFFGHKDWTKEQWRYLQDDTQYLFTDPKLAAAKAKELNAESTTADAPWKFMVKSETIMSANHAWRDWMTARFDSGEYLPVPWANEPWYNPDHFCHTALGDPFKVAFVESIVAGVEDRMTVTNPGRYLERFYNEKLDAKEIASWAAKADSEAELLFAATPDEIEEIYTTSGLKSCMEYKGDSNNFPLGIQPTRVYGAGDLQLAYLKRRNKIVARALVWPDRKVVGRIYGDEERMKNRLVAEGYTYKASDPTVFHGARLLKIEIEGLFVMPYLDWNMGVNNHPDDDAFFIMVDKNQVRKPRFAGQTQNGTASGESIQFCGHNGCRTRIVSGEGMYNSHTGRTMCYSCADEVLVRCINSGQMYPRDSTSYPISQILDRHDQPVPGYRGGWIMHHYAREMARLRMIGNNVYLASETELVPGSRRNYRPIQTEAVPA